MKKGILGLAVVAILGVPVTTASAQTVLRVSDPTPNGEFTDDRGNEGYVEVREDGVRACNENPDTLAGDELTGYAWLDADGDGNTGNTSPDGNDGITYGDGTIGAGDYDGEGNDDGDPENGTEENDCPAENAS